MKIFYCAIICLVTMFATQVYALSLDICANGLSYETSLNSDGTVAGDTVLTGTCLGTEMLSSGEGNVFEQLTIKPEILRAKIRIYYSATCHTNRGKLPSGNPAPDYCTCQRGDTGSCIGCSSSTCSGWR